MDEHNPSIIKALKYSLSIVHNPISGWFVLALSIVLTLGAYWIAKSQVSARAEEAFEYRSEEIVHAIVDRLATYEQALRGGVGLFNASDNVSRGEWQHYVASINIANHLPGIQGMGYAVPVPQHQLPQHVATIRNQGVPGYHIRPEHERDFYTAIIYLEPFDWRNQRALGYDMWSNAMRREAMKRARDTGEPATSGIITLVQETSKNVQRGFLTYLPVYSTKHIPETLDERQAQFQGWVYAAFRAGDLMMGILGSNDPHLFFSIYDGESINDEALLYSSHPESYANQVDLTVTKGIELQGRPWTIRFSALNSGLVNSSELNQPTYILVAGIIIDFLLFYVIVSLHLINRHAEKTAREMEADFQQSQQSLALQAHMVEAAEKEAETFFELAPDAFLVVDAEGKVVRANQQAHNLFNFQRGELYGVFIEQLIPPEYRDNHVKLRSEYQQTPYSRQMGERSFEGLRSDGSTFPVTVNLVAMEYRGKQHTVAAVHDVSVQKEIEQTLAHAKEKAEEASRSKSEFVANMSHEIRTPLNAVLGSAQLLETTSPNASQQKYITMIRGAGEALLGIINDILDFSKVEAGKMELSAAPFQLDEVMARLGMMMSVSVGEKPVELVIDVESDVPRQLNGDALRLQQVLMNLTSNAIKFTEKGMVKVVVSLAGQEDDHQILRFSVTDTGIGISKKQQENLFQAFSQADTTITRRFGGTGLGLVISSRIVEMMNGKLTLIGEPGVGSTFSFEARLQALPVNEEVDVQQTALLVLEPNLESQQSLLHIAQSQGWSVVCLASLEQARTLTQEQRSQIGKIVVSIELLQVRGEPIEQQLAVLGFSSLPDVVVSFSNNHQVAQVMSDSELVFGAVVVKPLTCNAIVAAFKESAMRAGSGDEQANSDQIEHPFKHRRILLVEDNRLNQVIAEGILASSGAELVFANNGEEALAIYEQQQGSLDLILMDVQMPVMDGVTATKALRQTYQCTLPIIAMTAGVLQSEQQLYLDAGMDAFVAKPIDSEHLHRTIAKFLNDSNR